MERGRCSVWEGISFGVGTKEDYARMARWHYRAGMPVGVTRVMVARWRETLNDERGTMNAGTANAERGTMNAEDGGILVGVLVETRAVLNCGLRNVAMPGRYVGADRRAAAARLNAEVRTIARVVIEPRFRGMGLAAELVRRCLATADVPRVEALASMGRTAPFFAAAGMVRYDRPMPAESVRLLAALAHEGLGARDLLELMPGAVSEFLAVELRRFWRSGRHWRGTKHEDFKHEDTKHTKDHEGDLEGKGVLGPGASGSRRNCTVEEAIADARRRVLSWPAYYLWQKPGAELARPMPPGDVGEMAEALTVFMTAREKRAVVEALRGVHPDLGVALRKLATNEHE